MQITPHVLASQSGAGALWSGPFCSAVALASGQPGLSLGRVEREGQRRMVHPKPEVYSLSFLEPWLGLSKERGLPPPLFGLCLLSSSFLLNSNLVLCGVGCPRLTAPGCLLPSRALYSVPKLRFLSPSFCAVQLSEDTSLSSTHLHPPPCPTPAPTCPAATLPPPRSLPPEAGLGTRS
jgi:hypothetical protein